MKNELEHIIRTYFSEDNTPIHFIGDGTHVEILAEKLSRLVPFDHPDAYAVLDDEVLIFEHFEFDSSNKLRRKGSQQRRSESEDNKAFAAVVPTEKGTLHHGTILADYTIGNYRENLRQVFCKHYNEIPGYESTLREKGIITNSKKVTTLFFVEDTTLLGNIFETENREEGWQPLVLPLCDFFLELFENSQDLDIVIAVSWYPNEYCLWYIDRSMIQDCKLQAIDTKEIRIINFDPQHVGVKISIPDSGFHAGN